MTIESASHPSPLESWHAQGGSPYLEIFGETRPQVNSAYAEFVPAGKVDGDPEGSCAAPVYEYWWTLAHAGSAHAHRICRLEGEPWDDLGDPAATVTLLFPLGFGWRVKELVTSVKYLSPAAAEHDIWNKMAAGYEKLAPEIQGLSSIGTAVAALAGGPAGGAVGASASTAVSWLDTIAKIKLTSVPPDAEDLAWSVEKVTEVRDGRVMQGVSWSLPPKMFQLLGGRITGGIAVSFIPDNRQQGGAPAERAHSAYAQGAICARAQINVHGEKASTVPENDGVVSLVIAPEDPPAPSPTPAGAAAPGSGHNSAPPGTP